MTMKTANALKCDEPANVTSLRMGEERIQQVHLALEIIGIDRQMRQVQMEYIPFEARQPAMRLRDAFIGIGKSTIALENVELGKLREDYALMVRHLDGVELGQPAKACIDGFRTKFDAFSKLCFG